jgi:SAM-dependent methyltransferase
MARNLASTPQPGQGDGMATDERLREEEMSTDERLREEEMATDERLREEEMSTDERLREEEMSMSEAQQAWEEHYGEHERVWSGRVNVRLAELVEPMTPGRALDLGCGEGADAMWLAEHGWHATAVDVSQTALDRAAADAVARNLAGRIDFQRHDLAESFPGGVFDLVSAQFLHSTVTLDRARLLRRAADAVAPGGVLMVVDHGAPPPWASKLNRHHHEFPTADEVVASLNLDDSQWDRVRVAAVERDAVGPAGQQAVLTDNVMVLRRR